MFTLNFHEFVHTMYKYALNSVVKISMMFMVMITVRIL